MASSNFDLSPSELLYARAAAIRAVQGAEMNPFSRALLALEAAAVDANAPVAIVGGLAAIRHRVPVTTIDIDIVVPLAEMNAFLSAVEHHGLSIKKRSPDAWHSLEFGREGESVLIEVLPEGGRTPRDPTDAPAIPHPRELGVESGLGYASFEGWAMLKLVANRDKDRYHLVEALKQATPEEVAKCVQSVRRLPRRYLVEFERLVRAAEDETRGG